MEKKFNKVLEMAQMVPHIRQDLLWLKLILMPSWK